MADNRSHRPCVVQFVGMSSTGPHLPPPAGAVTPPANSDHYVWAPPRLPVGMPATFPVADDVAEAFVSLRRPAVGVVLAHPATVAQQFEERQ